MENNNIFQDLHSKNDSIITHNNQCDTEIFGEFKSAQTPTLELLDIKKKFDEIMYQISLLRNEIKELKQICFSPNMNPQYPGSPRPAPIIYPTTPIYPLNYQQSSYSGQPNQKSKNNLYDNNPYFS